MAINPTQQKSNEVYFPNCQTALISDCTQTDTVQHFPEKGWDLDTQLTGECLQRPQPAGAENSFLVSHNLAVFVFMSWDAIGTVHLGNSLNKVCFVRICSTFVLSGFAALFQTVKWSGNRQRGQNFKFYTHRALNSFQLVNVNFLQRVSRTLHCKKHLVYNLEPFPFIWICFYAVGLARNSIFYHSWPLFCPCSFL